MGVNLSEREFKDLLTRSPQVRVKAGSRKTRRGASKRPQRPRSAQAQPHSPKRDYKAELVQQCGLIGLKLEPEFHFAKPRRFRADWKIKGLPVLLEYDGGLFLKTRSGHSSIRGILRDIEKANLAAITGYITIRCTPQNVVSGQALQFIERAVEQAKARIATVKMLRELQDK